MLIAEEMGSDIGVVAMDGMETVSRSFGFVAATGMLSQDEGCTMPLASA